MRGPDTTPDLAALRDEVARAMYDATDEGSRPDATPFEVSGYQDEVYREADAALDALAPHVATQVEQARRDALTEAADYLVQRQGVTSQAAGLLRRLAAEVSP